MRIDSELNRRRSLSDHEAMQDAERLCVPCKLCGGRAKITDAGAGWGYEIRCENSRTSRPSKGCLIDERRLSGWAYNIMDWWNRLHSSSAEQTGEAILPEQR